MDDTKIVQSWLLHNHGPYHLNLNNSILHLPAPYKIAQPSPPRVEHIKPFFASSCNGSIMIIVCIPKMHIDVTLYMFSVLKCTNIISALYLFISLYIQGHRNKIFVSLNGFWPLRGGGGQHLAVNFCKFGTKI